MRKIKKKEIFIGSIVIIFAIAFLIKILYLTNYRREIESSLCNAILTHNRNTYYPGETQTEGHKILKIAKINKSQFKVYCIVSYGEFGFENGIFTKISGSGAIPTVITLTKNESVGYDLSEYEESLDGEDNFKSTMSMFPFYLYPAVINSYKYQDALCTQQEAYAKQYLISIDRENSEVSGRHIEKTLAKMNTQASNKLLSLFDEYPYWIGTLEKLEDNVRYIYRKEYDDNKQIVTYTKEKEDGTVVEKSIIDTTNGELVFLEGTTISPK